MKEKQKDERMAGCCKGKIAAPKGNTMKKYELLRKDMIDLMDRTLYRVRYLRDFADIKVGDLGGYIEKEENLSHDGNARICDSARVYGKARVYGDAAVYDNARIFGKARIYDDAWVYGNARLYGSARVSGNSRVYGDADVHGNAYIFGSAWVFGDVEIYGDAWVFDDARVYGNIAVYGSARVYGDSICSVLSPINIIGLQWNTTLTDNNIHIGCRTVTFEKALALASRWKATTLKYKEAETIKDEKKLLVEAIKMRLKQLEKARKETL